MNTNIALCEERPGFRVCEDRGEYDTDLDNYAAAAEGAKHLYEAQRQVGDALNLAGLLLKSMEDEGDARAMQIFAAVDVIEKKLEEAFRLLGTHEADYTSLYVAHADLRGTAGDDD